MQLGTASTVAATTETTSTATADTNTEYGLSGGPTNPTTHADFDLSHYPDDEPAGNRSSSNTQNLPQDFTSFEDFNPAHDDDIFRAFDSFQDFNPSEDWSIEEILKNSENLHIPGNETIQQESNSYGDPLMDGVTPTLYPANTSLPQFVA